MSSQQAYEQFMTPGRPPERTRREQELLEAGRPLFAKVREQQIVGWSWGSGPKVIVQHGWGARATMMWAIIKGLVENGFEVIAYDAPGNGDSEGEYSSLFHFAETLIAVHDAHGPFEAIVAHSIGASATPLAISRGLRVNRAVLVSVRNDIEQFLSRFLELTDQSADLYDEVKRLWSDQYGWENVKAAVPAKLATQFDIPALLIHDRDDADVPVQDSLDLQESWKGSQFHLTEGLGHTLIIRNKAVVQEILTFLTK